MGGVSQMGAKGAGALATMADVLFGGEQLFPTEVGVYLGTMAGRRDPITEESFTDDEIAAIREMAGRALSEGRNAVGGAGYQDYRGNMGDPAYSAVQHTLGRFRVDGTADGMNISDTYDFDPEYGATRWESAKNLLDVLPGVVRGDDLDTYQAALIAGEAFGPRGPRGSWGAETGQGRTVNITIPYEADNERDQMNRKRIIQQLLSGM